MDFMTDFMTQQRIIKKMKLKEKLIIMKYIEQIIYQVIKLNQEIKVVIIKINKK